MDAIPVEDPMGPRERGEALPEGLIELELLLLLLEGEAESLLLLVEAPFETLVSLLLEALLLLLLGLEDSAEAVSPDRETEVMLDWNWGHSEAPARVGPLKFR